MAVRALEIGGPGWAGPLMQSDAEPELPLAKELRRVLGPRARIIWHGAELDLYARDQADIPHSLPRMLIRTTPDVVVQPETVEDVANVVAAAYDLGIPVIPRGDGGPRPLRWPKNPAPRQRFRSPASSSSKGPRPPLTMPRPPSPLRARATSCTSTRTGCTRSTGSWRNRSCGRPIPS